ncbi:hypothetical protein [Pseudomonas jilinensis]|uniref:Uncharacterized protein n=1 Tax=Pseudomonas jilinensis TaxID=2078689 RepID=A0A396SGC7_9PSED|nr:hypothetical protein [Pseudomonas jilinensis]RHW22676.1 hypothetical protein C2846_03360 [Pseudomonas jilinensis]
MELEPSEPIGSPTPERDLWGAVLAMLLDDALGYWRGSYGPAIAQEQAFDDVLRVGPMLRHCCQFTGHNPQWIAERFVRLLECG